MEISPNLLDIPNDDVSNDSQETTRSELGTIDLFRHGGSRKVTFIMMIDWIAINLGMSWNNKYSGSNDNCLMPYYNN